MLSSLAIGLAAAVLVGAALYALLLAFSAARQARQAAHMAKMEHQLLRERIDAVAQRSRFEREAGELSWNGARKFRISRKVPEADGIASFYLVPHDGKPLPPFNPGQFLTFSLRLPGSEKPLVRCYSLSDAPEAKDYYRVTIKKVPPAPGKAKGGQVSSYFHEALREGDIVDVKAPSGQFYLDTTRQSPVVLIGGGVGLTPVLSMLNSIVAARSRRETWFFYGVPNRTQHAMKAHLETVAQQNDNVKLHICYSDPGEHDVQGRDYQHKERFSVDLMKRLLPSNNYDYYLCGPPPMMDGVIAGLKAWGVPESAVHFESFGAGTAKTLAPAAPAAEQGGVAVSFARSGKKASWTPKSGSILELAEAAGVAIPSGCRTGNCGTCLTAIQSGEVEYLVPPGSPPEKGSCLACVARPKGALALDA